MGRLPPGKERPNARQAFCIFTDVAVPGDDRHQWRRLAEQLRCREVNSVARRMARAVSARVSAEVTRGIVSPLLVNQSSKQVVPISSFVDVDGLPRDILQIADRGRSVSLIKAQLALAVLRRFNPRRAPTGFTIADLRALLERFLPRFRSDVPNWQAEDNADPQWRLLMVVGLWFHDLFTFDFSVIGMDAVRTAIPLSAQIPPEISFCAYRRFAPFGRLRRPGPALRAPGLGKYRIDRED
jgi:hypothetical protein